MGIALTIGIKFPSRAVMEDTARLDGPAHLLHPALSVDLGADRLTRELDRPAGHHGLSRGGAGASRSDGRIRRPDQHAVDAQLGANDLGHDSVDSLADVYRRGLHLGDGTVAIDGDSDPCLG